MSVEYSHASEVQAIAEEPIRDHHAHLAAVRMPFAKEKGAKK